MNSEDHESIPPADPNLHGGVVVVEEDEPPRREDSLPLSMSSEEQDSIAVADPNLDSGVAVVEEDESPRREDSLPLSTSSEEQDFIVVADPNLDGGVAAEEDGEPPRREDFGKMLYGCEHYRRRCKLRTPCCDQIFTCRHCHNEAAGALSDPKKIHELVRQDVKQVICAVCDTEQEVSELCSNCGVKFGEYFCGICKFYDDDISKEVFHCDDCGICRVGGREKFFHCVKCGSCYSVELQNNHSCVENSMKNYCPICYEFMFDSVKGAQILKCGHTMHMDCFREMMKKNQYRCPICSKSAVDMTSSWESIDQEIAATPMPEDYRYEVTILCNDCNSTSESPFHIFGHKCKQCNSYNTRRLKGENSQ